MIKVLQVSRGLGIGGIERTVQLFTRHLDRRWFAVSVCGTHSGGIRGEQMASEGHDVFSAHGCPDRFREYVRDRGFDVVHFHETAGDTEFVRTAKDSGVSLIVETSVFGRPSAAVDDFIDIKCFVAKFAAVRYAAWTGGGEEFFSKARVIYTPIDLQEIDNCRQIDTARADLLGRLHIPNGARIIGRPGRAHPSKWSPIIVRMMKDLLKSEPRVMFLAWGAPPEFRRCVESQGLASQFVYLEPSPNFAELVAFYSVLEILTYASENGEIMSGVLSEAMACQLPVVVDSTPLRDNGQIEQLDHGETGLVASNPTSFAEAVSYLLRNPEEARRLGQNGRKKVEEHYSVRKVVKCLTKIYIDGLQAAGKAVSPELLSEVRSYQLDPTGTEVRGFADEYRRRLRQSWGPHRRVEVGVAEHLAWNVHLHNVGRRLKWLVPRH